MPGFRTSFLSILSLLASQIAAFPPPSSTTYVGELQERWQFPSDHLPIGIFLQDANSSFRILSWNVLNTAYIKWIDENSQGLARSGITQENIPIKENGFTVREQHVIDSLLNMAQAPHCPNNILCLQECSERFIQELSRQLPSHIKIIRSSDAATKNQNIVLYNATAFDFVEKNLHSRAFPSEPSRPLMEVVLEKQGIRYRIFNAHLRCESSSTQKFELAQFVYAQKHPEEVTIALGDLNTHRAQMEEAFASQRREPNSFLSFSPYKTTVSPELHSKTIDHIFLDPGPHSLTIREVSPNELLDGLQDLVDLLN
jgi:endonuclease/exonuclease/phosphatase family metal-dependent hydrolase